MDKFFEKYNLPKLTQQETENLNGHISIKVTELRAFLVVQWLRTHLAMQGMLVQSLVWEDPTCYGATNSVHHNYLACDPPLLSPPAGNPEAKSIQLMSGTRVTRGVFSLQ